MEINATLIKNPLTIVGIFAGLVEIAGTAVMPFLSPNIQIIYVWFLMVFPAVLVIAFFLTLYFRHHVLYAPSDYRADEGFHRWAPANARAVQLKAEVEQAESLAEQISGGTAIDAPAEPTTAVQMDPSAVATAQEIATSSPTQESAVNQRDVISEPRLEAVEVARMVRVRPSITHRRRFENFLVEEFERRYGAKFLRDTQFDARSYVYDAVDLESNIPMILEMKYTVRGLINAKAYDEYLQAAKDVYDRLPANKKLNFIFIFVYYSDTRDQGEISRIRRSLNVLRSAAADFPFKVLAEYFSMVDPIAPNGRANFAIDN